VFGDVFADVFAGAFADVFPDVFADVFAGAFADVFPDVFADVFAGVFADVFADVFAGVSADVFAEVVADVFAGVFADVFAGVFTGVSADVELDLDEADNVDAGFPLPPCDDGAKAAVDSAAEAARGVAVLGLPLGIVFAGRVGTDSGAPGGVGSTVTVPGAVLFSDASGAEAREPLATGALAGEAPKLAATRGSAAFS